MDSVRVSPQKIKIVAVGDIIFGGTVTEALLRKGIEWAVDDLGKLFEGADLIIGNLESPITDRKNPRPGQLFSFKMPTSLAPLLKAFDGVSVANNHILDYGVEGLFDTINRLDRIGVQYCGAGESLRSAIQTTVFNLDGFRIGMTSFTDRNWYPSGPTTPGTSTWQGRDSCDVIRRLARDTDFVIVQIHQGYEFLDYPGPEELSVVQKATDSGADLVLCHHSHTLMGVARNGGAIAAYGLGNFICDNNIHAKHLGKVRRRAAFFFQTEKHKVLSCRIIPLIPDEIGWPVLATGEEFFSIHQHVKMMSDVLNDDVATIKLFHEQAAELMLPHAVSSLANLFRKEGLASVLSRLGRLRWVDLVVIAHHICSSIKGKG